MTHLLSMLFAATIAVTNPTQEQRQEVVEIDTTGLGLPAGFVVRDAFGIERTAQLTYDGKLLVDVHVRPAGTATYTIQEGIPAPVRSSVGGRQYPERLDDIAFENDRIGFRLYGPALQRKGEKGFGHDVWVKRTPELVLEELYRNDPRMSFHLDYGKGLDCYGVGPTLGLGTPALIRDGRIQYPWCYATYQILDKGPLRFTVRVDFPTTEDGITEHRILTLDKGTHFCKAQVWYDGLRTPTDVVAGFAIRPADTTSIVMGKDYVHYADPTIDPDRHQTQIYVALLFPDTPVEITTMEGHALGICRQYECGVFCYYFGAAWSEYDVRSQKEWQAHVDGVMQARRNPFIIKVKR
ncbi:MAG: DUF4861 family protein [Prevotella sp.]|nr:DUF4861 family protein [Prevotella sp.]